MTQFDWTIAWGLAAILVVGGVWIFNAWQERSWRRKAQEAFRQEPNADVLLGEKPSVDRRQEPRFSADEYSEPPASDEWVEADVITHADTPDGGRAGILDSEVDYVVSIQVQKSLNADELKRALEQSDNLPRRPLWEGLHELSGWEALAPDHAEHYLTVRAGLQLVDRSGVVEQTALARFCDHVQYLCDRWSARIQYPDRRQALEQARKLDGFCAQIDVVIGLNIVSRDGMPLPMNKIVQLADAAGLRPNPPAGWLFQDDEGHALFALTHIEGQALDPARAFEMTCFGMTFTLDVPKVYGGVTVFERVSALARHFANQLDADLVDDHRNPLNDAALESIRQQLTVIYSNMELRGLTPGGALTQRVFS